jgi:glycine cleavage system T protein (aminomethyltransferase)
MALQGYSLVDNFGDPAGEARACRSDCAVFDFSFLECASVHGKHAWRAIENFTGRPVISLGIGQILYAMRLDAAGMAVADLTVWRTGAEMFEVMSGRREDVTDLIAQAEPGVEVVDLSATRAIFAVQGPGTLAALAKFADVRAIASLKFFTWCRAELAGIPCVIGRIGYTGEAGFEIFVEKDRASDLWQLLTRSIRPAGFTAADILRIEAGFVLFTNEFSIPVTPREAGLDKFGASLTADPAVRLICFRAEASPKFWPWRPPKGRERPTVPGNLLVTSACDSIVAGGILGLGYTRASHTPAKLFDPVGEFQEVRLVSTPFYDARKRRPRAAWRGQV